jgi:UDP-N-acetyl-D-mannosaminuronic acid transferase (WecB/TagA/CpsF family)
VCEGALACFESNGFKKEAQAERKRGRDFRLAFVALLEEGEYEVFVLGAEESVTDG